MYRSSSSFFLVFIFPFVVNAKYKWENDTLRKQVDTSPFELQVQIRRPSLSPCVQRLTGGECHQWGCQGGPNPFSWDAPGVPPTGTELPSSEEWKEAPLPSFPFTPPSICCMPEGKCAVTQTRAQLLGIRFCLSDNLRFKPLPERLLQLFIVISPQLFHFPRAGS